MRIDRLHIQNFRKFVDLTLDLHPRFTLLVGGNGSGKTSILDALVVSLGVWFHNMPNGLVTPPLQRKDARLIPKKVGDRIQFQEQLPIRVKTIGQIGESGSIDWEERIDSYAQSAVDTQAQNYIAQLLIGDPSNLSPACPVLAYYGVNRAAILENKQILLNMPLTPARRWDAYNHFHNVQIDYNNLRSWFYRETAAAGVNAGRPRPGFEVVHQAVLECLPGANDLWFDVDRADLVCSIDGQAQPLAI